MNVFPAAIRIFLLMTVLTGLVYPLIITGIARLTMPQLAEGSLLRRGDRIVGSALISQPLQEDRYFWFRPSAIHNDPMAPSGGSNLGPTSQKLKELIAERKRQFGDQAPSGLLYASGSGLDPHIDLETAYYQIPRVAKARNLQATALKQLIDNLSEGRQLGFIGPRYVNVLTLNLALDEQPHEQQLPLKNIREPQNGAAGGSPGEGGPVRGNAPLGKEFQRELLAP